MEELNRKLFNKNIIGGYELGKAYEGYKDAWLIAVTEKRTKEEIDNLIEKIDDILQ